jgi:hypothetical protein
MMMVTVTMFTVATGRSTTAPMRPGTMPIVTTATPAT